jgi:hypothetical protein
MRKSNTYTFLSQTTYCSVYASLNAIFQNFLNQKNLLHNLTKKLEYTKMKIDLS